MTRGNGKETSGVYRRQNIGKFGLFFLFFPIQSMENENMVSPDVPFSELS